VPIRPLQLHADGGYQLRLGVLGVPLIMVPDKIACHKIPIGKTNFCDNQINHHFEKF
jgi:GT2 family glycosyltransferase